MAIVRAAVANVRTAIKTVSQIIARDERFRAVPRRARVDGQRRRPLAAPCQQAFGFSYERLGAGAVDIARPWNADERAERSQSGSRSACARRRPRRGMSRRVDRRGGGFRVLVELAQQRVEVPPDESLKPMVAVARGGLSTGSPFRPRLRHSRAGRHELLARHSDAGRRSRRRVAPLDHVDSASSASPSSTRRESSTASELLGWGAGELNAGDPSGRGGHGNTVFYQRNSVITRRVPQQVSLPGPGSGMSPLSTAQAWVKASTRPPPRECQARPPARRRGPSACRRCRLRPARRKDSLVVTCTPPGVSLKRHSWTPVIPPDVPPHSTRTPYHAERQTDAVRQREGRARIDRRGAEGRAAIRTPGRLPRHPGRA